MGEYYCMRFDLSLMLQPDFHDAIQRRHIYKNWRPGTPLPDPSTDIGYSVTNLDSTFYGFKVKRLDLSLWDVSHVITASQMFENSDIQELDLSMLNFDNCEDISFMFFGCDYLKTLDFSNNSFSKMSCCSNWLSSNIEVLDISGYEWSFTDKDDCDNVLLPPYATKHLQHFFVNNEEQKAILITAYDLENNQVHAVNSDNRYLYSCECKTIQLMIQAS